MYLFNFNEINNGYTSYKIYIIYNDNNLIIISLINLKQSGQASCIILITKILISLRDRNLYWKKISRLSKLDCTRSDNLRGLKTADCLKVKKKIYIAWSTKYFLTHIHIR